MVRVCRAFLSVHCSLVVTCLEMAGHLALLYIMFYYVSVTFPRGVLGQVCYLIVSIPELCLLTYFHRIALTYRRIAVKAVGDIKKATTGITFTHALMV